MSIPMTTWPTWSSPHPWGCFLVQGDGGGQETVFPTPVGVFLSDDTCASVAEGLPHTRGGVSNSDFEHGCLAWSSPHPWGCFLGKQRCRCHLVVFPTPVGVFLHERSFHALVERLPHTRGGVSGSLTGPWEMLGSSPHPWGCFLFHGMFLFFVGVFPTPVGVFLL